MAEPAGQTFVRRQMPLRSRASPRRLRTSHAPWASELRVVGLPLFANASALVLTVPGLASAQSEIVCDSDRMLAS